MLGEDAGKEAPGRIRIKYGGRYIRIDSANEEISVLIKEIERPVARAMNLGKILCPNDHCTDNKEFFLTCGSCESVIVTHSGT